MSRHDARINQALRVAKSSTYRWKHGAVVVRGGRVIGFAPNKFRNSPFVDPENVTDHAEAAIIRELLKNYSDLRNSTIYIARISNNDEIRMSRPCPDCMKLIVEAGIKEIVYTNEINGYSIEQIRALDMS
jgi:tRNA(Arg) A34 adenosine deaminase TadA